MTNLKIITLNVNGITQQLKRQKVFHYLGTLNVDIICLQETHGQDKYTTEKWSQEWGRTGYWSTGTAHGRGVGVLLRPNLEADVQSFTTDEDGRLVSLVLHYANHYINVINIYTPTEDHPRQAFYESLSMSTEAAQFCIIAGDFNCIPDPSMDKTGGNPDRRTPGVTQLHRWTNNEDTRDIWRTKHPHVKQFTWEKADKTIKTRIDRIYITTSLIETATANIVTCPLSDHDAVTATIQLPCENPRGPGIWKLNNTILSDTSYCHEISSFLDYWLTRQHEYESISQWWDDQKEHIKRISIKHSTRLARSKHKEKLETLQRIDQLNQADPEDERIATAKETLNTILETEATGNIIRSRVVWHEHREKPTRYFFSLKKKKQQQHTITAVKTTAGRINTDMDILDEAYHFYQELYRAEETDQSTQRVFLDGISKKLTRDAQLTCEGKVTTAELRNALHSMHNNKSPGNDGLTAEFYRTFWHKLAEPFTAVANQNHAATKMSPSQREALLKLLFKKNDKEPLKNWRPISLLNVDYKILAKALALRLRQVLSEIVHTDQTCGIPTRSIHENIMKIRDVIHHTHSSGQAIVIGVDQEKAFDRVDRNYLFQVLEAMNFGPSFIQWIKTLYHGATSTILNNGGQATK